MIMELNDFILIDTFALPIKNGTVFVTTDWTNSKHFLELEDIRNYPIVRQFIASPTSYRLELKTLDYQRAFIFQKNKECVTVLYFSKS